jgi:hypothetical protein
VVHTYINAMPHQVMGYFADRSKAMVVAAETLDVTYTVDTALLQIPIPIPTVSDRESLYRSVKFRNDEERSYTTVFYTVEDERKPVVKGKVRIESLAATVVKEAPGTEGEKSEVWRMSRTNFKFGVALGFINSLAATTAAELIVAPLEKLKLNVERLLKEYKPPEHFVEELDLTWKGGLWRMALEAALGVQYLHHHRYERERSERKGGLGEASKRSPNPTNFCAQVLERWGEAAQRGDQRGGGGGGGVEGASEASASEES